MDSILILVKYGGVKNESLQHAQPIDKVGVLFSPGEEWAWIGAALDFFFRGGDWYPKAHKEKRFNHSHIREETHIK